MKESTIYSRWLRKELTEEEKAQLKASGDMEILEKIIAETDTWTLPEMKENSFRKLQEKIHAKKFEETEVIPIKNPNYRIYGIAASFALIVFSVYLIFFHNNSLTYQCKAGQQLKVTLPDRTVVVLNGESRISIDENTFTEKRKVHLSGQGYFDVLQKGDFTVTFSQGEVNVLGTKFNILSGKELATVKCYDGRVKVTDKTKKTEILNSGQGARFNQSTLEAFRFNTEVADWTNDESIFNDAPLLEVINSLSIHFNARFETNTIDLQRNYSGKFIHSDLKTALEMVFVPMNISYTIDTTNKERPKVFLK